MIKELRDRTGVGMGKCKEASGRSQRRYGTGHRELAQSRHGLGREKRRPRHQRRHDRHCRKRTKHVALVEINAETDFVVKNDRFSNFCRNIAEEVAATKPASLEAFLQQKYSKDPRLTIDQYRATIIQTIGENIQIRRLKVISKRLRQSMGVYSHLGGKIVTLVEITGQHCRRGLGERYRHAYCSSSTGISFTGKSAFFDQRT